LSKSGSKEATATYVIGDVHGRSRLLDQLLRDVPWNIQTDKIVFLGDLIDRGNDAPGVIDRVMEIQAASPNVVVLRGNHEQMLLDCLDYGDPQWLIPENGGIATLASYGITLSELNEIGEIDIPARHIDFIRNLPFYHEDEQAIYVHAGLVPGRHPSETDPTILMWSRDRTFYTGYDEKLCFFGHTPTQFLPREGRKRRFGIYVRGGCIGMDTSGDEQSPLSCIKVETFTLYQAYPTGVTEVERLARLKPSPKSASNGR